MTIKSKIFQLKLVFGERRLLHEAVIKKEVMYNLGLLEGLQSLLALWSRLEQLRRWSVIRKCFTMLYYLFHPQITIVETGEYKWLAIGITNEAYKTSEMPGWYEESLGYHTDDGNIFHNTKHLEDAIGTKGIKN